jgi:hypothetical protein
LLIVAILTPCNFLDAVNANADRCHFKFGCAYYATAGTLDTEHLTVTRTGEQVTAQLTTINNHFALLL